MFMIQINANNTVNDNVPLKIATFSNVLPPFELKPVLALFSSLQLVPQFSHNNGLILNSRDKPKSVKKCVIATMLSKFLKAFT